MVASEKENEVLRGEDKTFQFYTMNYLYKKKKKKKQFKNT
jgi:hypothetical protein